MAFLHLTASFFVYYAEVMISLKLFIIEKLGLYEFINV